MVSVSDITLSYGEKVIAGGISFTVDKGECVLLCGPNGSGKTTLLRKLSGQRGTVMIPAKIPKVGGFTLREFILTSLWKAPWRENEFEKALKTLGIEDLAERDISTLSDGEFQKGCIASALTREAETILLDEPTAFLDVDGRIMVLGAMREAARHRAVIFSSHDVSEAERFCTRTMGLTRDGRFLDSARGDEDIFKTCFEKYG